MSSEHNPKLQIMPSQPPAEAQPDNIVRMTDEDGFIRAADATEADFEIVYDPAHDPEMSVVTDEAEQGRPVYSYGTDPVNLAKGINNDSDKPAPEIPRKQLPSPVATVAYSYGSHPDNIAKGLIGERPTPPPERPAPEAAKPSRLRKLALATLPVVALGGAHVAAPETTSKFVKMVTTGERAQSAPTAPEGFSESDAIKAIELSEQMHQTGDLDVREISKLLYEAEKAGPSEAFDGEAMQALAEDQGNNDLPIQEK